MKEWEKRFLRYCVEQRMLDSKRAGEIRALQKKLASQGEKKNLLAILNREIGLDSNTAKEHLAKACPDIYKKLYGKDTPLKKETPNDNRSPSQVIEQDGKDFELLDDQNPKASEPDLKDKSTKIGKYVLIEKLGAGGMGVVYKAFHPELNHHVAIKTIKSGQEGEDEQIKRFMREANVVAKLKHPNIVAVHDMGEENGQHYIVMDYIQGNDLKDIIHTEKLYPRFCLEIIKEIAEALDCAHGQGIIHRDIKPSNIIISRQNKQPYLMDFGLASVVEKESGITRSGQVLGTPQYMSPEQAKGKAKRLDARSDIYSLGTVLYEMLTGKPVVQDGTVMQILYRVVNKEPVPLSRHSKMIAQDVEAITMKCLEKDPGQRYQSAQALANDIHLYLRGEPILARAPSLYYRLSKWARKNRGLTLVILATLLIIMGLMIWKIAADRSKLENVYLKGQEKEREGDLKAASEHYHLVLSSSPGHLSSLEGLDRIKQKIESLNRNGREKEVEAQQSPEQDAEKTLDQAIECYQQILRWDPKNSEAGLGIERIKNTKGKNRLNKELQEKNKELTKSRMRYNGRLYYDEAMESFVNPNLSQADIENCITLFSKAIEEDPTFGEAYFQRGRAYQRLYKNQEALEDYQESITQNPYLTSARYYYAMLIRLMVNKSLNTQFSQVNSLKLEERINDMWKNVSEKVPEARDKYLLLAKAQWQFLNRGSDNEEDSFKLCNQIIDENPTFADPYFLRAQYYGYRTVYAYPGVFEKCNLSNIPRDLNRALDDIYHGLTLDPHRLEGYWMAGAIYQSIGDYSSAEAEYTKAIRLKSDVPVFYRFRTTCRAALLDHKGALSDLGKYTSLMQDKYLSYQEQVETQKSSAGVRQERLRESFLINFSMYFFLKNEKDRAARELHAYQDILSKGEMDDFALHLLSGLIADNPEEIRTCFRKIMGKGNSKHHSRETFLTMFQMWVPQLQQLTEFVREKDNFFCAEPKIKQLSHSSFANILSILAKNEMIKVDSFEGHHGPFFKEILKKLDKEGKLKKIDQIIESEFKIPLKCEYFLCAIINKTEDDMMPRLFQMSRLSSASLYYRRAVAYYSRGNYEKVCQDLKSALDKEPGSMELHYGMATVLSLLSKDNPENKDKAIFHLEQAAILGWNDFKRTREDSDFQAIRDYLTDERIRSWADRYNMEKNWHNKIEEDMRQLSKSGKNLEAICLFRSYHDRLNIYLKDIHERIEESAFSGLLDKGMELKKQSQKKELEELSLTIDELFNTKRQREWKDRLSPELTVADNNKKVKEQEDDKATDKTDEKDIKRSIISKKGWIVEFQKQGKFSDSEMAHLIYPLDGGEAILDMSSETWIKLTHSRQVVMAKLYQKLFADQLGQPIEKSVTAQGVPFDVVLVPPGRCWIGCPAGETKVDTLNEVPRHRVIISRAFWFGKYEASQHQWYTLTGEKPWYRKENVKDNPQHSVTCVSWDDIKQKFLTKLGANFSLPTESQWEYACRAGTLSCFYWGDESMGTEIEKYAWYNCILENEYVRNGGQKIPNGWGLYDMGGNAYELCQDWTARYTSKELKDPSGPPFGFFRIVRGGGCDSRKVLYCKSACRDHIVPNGCHPYLGFRIVMNFQ